MTEVMKDTLTSIFVFILGVFGMIFSLALLIAVIAAPFVAIGTGIAGAVWAFRWIVGL